MTTIFIISALMIIGVALMIAELFLLPGFGAAGIAGIVSWGAAIACAYVLIGTRAGNIVLIVSLILAAVGTIVFFRSHAIQKMGLNTEIDGQVEMPKAGKHMEQLTK